MFSFPSTKSISQVATTLGLITVSNLILIDSAGAFSVTLENGGFESAIGGGSQNGWNTIGDVTTIGAIDSISPLGGSNQAIITTSYIKGNYIDPIGNRNDDSDFNFNQSLTNPVSADTNPNADFLQEHFGFDTNAFSIPRTSATIGDPRTSKEGSGMYQDFTVTLDSGETGFKISFDWSYLTNDGSTSSGGEQDFGFWSLGQIDGSTYTTAFSGTGNPSDQIEVLKSSSGSISAPSADHDYVSTFDYATNGTKNYTVDGLTAGTYTYRVGYGVVDVDSVDRTSALLLDELNIQQVPFEFSPTLGIFIVGGMIGCDRIRRQYQAKLKCNDKG
ncbi:MAG: hypothetical protein Tsb0014_47340 [Pleurocapsa sp.]